MNWVNVSTSPRRRSTCRDEGLWRRMPPPGQARRWRAGGGRPLRRTMLGVSFYRRIADDRFEATPYTRGPWDAGSQHAGPPAALLGWAVEHQLGRDDMRVARLTFDIIRPVPIRRLTVSTRVVRAGRSVAVVESELIPDGEPTAMRVTAMLIREIG